MGSSTREVGSHLGGLFDTEAAVDEFFSPASRTRGLARRQVKARPAHYRTVSVTLYNEDLQRLDALLAELKRRGHTRANKSLIIREALRQIDLDVIPPQR
ncbi:MAG: hypothetical protein KC549_12300 [Myxococcales bacterium]|nr:hypothetical protein [Myxococcales bacterium]MCB9547740.1 hypothetical protein [Myxococcales bacterium]